MRGPTVGAAKGWWGAAAERVAASLFVVPALFVVAGVATALLAVWADGTIPDATELPLVLEPTIASSRAVLTTVAAATMTVSGIAFSVALLVVQLASSQYSPRVTHGLFRDRANKRSIGIALGTFAYCLVGIQNLRDVDGREALPVTTSLAVVLGLGALLAIVAFIDHNAHMMDVSQILGRTTDDTIGRLGDAWGTPAGPVDGGAPRPEHEGERPDASTATPAGQGLVVAAATDGWVRTVDAEALLGAVEPGGTLVLRVGAGDFVVTGAPVAELWPVPRDSAAARTAVLAAVHTGGSRTMQQDVAFGIRQLVDVALRALSPGVNDPTTAVDALHHATAALRAMLCAERPPQVLTAAGPRRVVRPVPSPADLVGLTFDEIRVAAVDLPRVQVAVLRSLAQLREAVGERPEVDRELDAQAAALLAAASTSTMGAVDRRRVTDTYAALFSSSPSGTA